nr:immunoglobulin light chain junction region [Macaca mulatta]MOX69617.1 immunoglobulin light chain junction region [Macaca mulatta]MOX70225.1 immunoglobulin light chain junction region [Macaca mulatta]MOX72393.1 immunoglobulin light chain junction region [Macaca mulatta]MOX73950.1 immunoglobulin light chain junction region [Macaca mulatta]
DYYCQVWDNSINHFF